MLEGEEDQVFTMEKRAPGRQNYVPPNKSNGAESKKDNGSNISKQGRCNKKKEYSRPKYDQAPRKPNPQKSRALDKRPRARGYSKNSPEEEMTSTEKQDPEYGSVQAWGSKKSNMSHLLNFHFEQRDAQGSSSGLGRGQANNSWRGRRKWEGRNNIPYNKERFLQANCQFVVSGGDEYTSHVADPDTLVDWDLIEQVRISGNEVPSCPICLYPPTAAKITRCGHIYCWTCILHYLSLGEKTWRKCPICYESVHEKDLKGVMALQTKKNAVGEEIAMKLMKRERGSTIAIPKDLWEPRDGVLFNMDDDKDCTCYSKLLTATPEQVQQIINMERSELESQLLEESDENGLDASYIKSALDSVKTRQGNLSPKLQAQCDVADMMENMKIETSDTEETNGPVFHAKPDAVHYTDAFDDVEVPVEEALLVSAAPEPPATPERPTTPPPLDMPVCDSAVSLASMASANSTGSEALDSRVDDPLEDHTVSSQNDSDDTNTVVDGAEEDHQRGATCFPSYDNAIFYYQATDGQHIYMHSLNARCLVREYGSLQNCPATITARIVELEGTSMTEDLRRRLKYLNHLPLTCEFQVAELALVPPVLSVETLRLFADDIEKRGKMRMRKQRDEKRRSKKIQMEENKKFGIDPTARIVWSSQSESEPVPVAFAPPDSIDSTPAGSPIVTSVELPVGSPTSTGSSEDGQLSSMSFAQMLKAGKAKEAWPKSDKPDTDAAPGVRERKDSQDTDDENKIPVPTFQSSFGDAIQAALDSYAKGGETVEAVVNAPSAVGDNRGKKKKRQKKLLFTTTISRSK